MADLTPRDIAWFASASELRDWLEANHATAPEKWVGMRPKAAGRPTVTMKVGFLPPPDFEATTLEEFMVLGHIMTATPPLNAIPAVVAAAPGIVTYNDLHLILPRGVVPA